MSLVRYESVSPAAEWCAAQRELGKTIGFVPTMGALHEGHLGLVERSVASCDVTVVSVFVNPLQFDDPGDLERYPRDLDADARLLEGIGCDLVFTGTLPQFFPDAIDEMGSLEPGTLRSPGPCAEGLEGDSRAGHFIGVATIVHRLFEVVVPTRAFFGRKDYQQALVVQEVARRLGGPEIEVCPTSREEEGLAQSSRNQRLSESEREVALILSQALASCDAKWRSGVRDPDTLQATLAAPFEGASGVRLDYAAVRDLAKWTAEDPIGRLDSCVALVAARVGPVRLIDNLILGEGEACEIQFGAGSRT